MEVATIEDILGLLKPGNMFDITPGNIGTFVEITKGILRPGDTFDLYIRRMQDRTFTPYFSQNPFTLNEITTGDNSFRIRFAPRGGVPVSSQEVRCDLLPKFALLPNGIYVCQAWKRENPLVHRSEHVYVKGYPPIE